MSILMTLAAMEHRDPIAEREATRLRIVAAEEDMGLS